MPVCPQCPGRSFKDDHALQQHRDAGRHATQYECNYCNRMFTTDAGRQSHQVAVHLECHHCDRNFNSEQGRQQHEHAKHSSTYECDWCDHTFATDAGRLAHQEAVHFECHYCDQNFNSEQGRQQHERAKHPPTYECDYCNRTFTTDTGRLSHQVAVHLECHHCDQSFNSEGARQQHEHAKHSSTFECDYCDQEFSSEGALDQHQDAKHSFHCNYCSNIFSQPDLLWTHEQNVHSKCRYCSDKFDTHSAKTLHEQSCACNPATHITHPLDHPTLGSSSRSSNERQMMEIDERPSSSSITPLVDDVLELDVSSLSDSIMVDGETFHSTGEIPYSDAVGGGTSIKEPCACFGNEQTSSDTDKPVPDNAENAIPVDNNHHDDSADLRIVTFKCAACLDSFSTEQTYLGHTCPYRTVMLKPHCPVCYSQFEDETLLHRHLEGLESFSCQLCQTQCCSEEMKQDHLFSHPMCAKCGESFADNLALCGHVESNHPVVVCWDCDGIVVEKDSLGLHYTESPVHPSCVFCSVGMKNSDAMDEHVRHLHSSVTVIPSHPGSSDVNANPNEESPVTENEPPGENENAVGLPSELPDSVPPSPVIEPIVPLGGHCEEAHTSPSRTESSLPLSPQPPMPAQVKCLSEPAEEPCVINGGQLQGGVDVDGRQYTSPSPTPSEHGSDGSDVQQHATSVTDAVINNDTRSSSPVSTISADSSFSDTGRTTSSHSVVFVSADGIPGYIRENRAVLVATSAGSPSSGRTPLRLPSTSSLESLNIVERIQRVQTRCEERSTNPGSVAHPTHRLHCRICLKDPCDEMTATICGHLFCKRCITRAVVAKSECPVCESATLLYCLFKLDLSA